jgi:23S rRNA (uracil1939-C5)-methyltransferase
LKNQNSLTLKPGNEIELTIESLAYFGGRGVGRHDGVVIFVPYCVPGDFIRARITVKKPRFYEGELVEVLKPSEHRRVPPCPVAGACGGCSWQQVNYSEQIVQKEKILKDNLRKIEKHGSFETRPFVAAQEEFGYRNRIQLHTQNGRWGFYAQRTRDLVSFEKCLISEDAINEQIKKLKISDFSGGQRLEIVRTEEGSVRLLTGQRAPDVHLFSQVNEKQNKALKKIVLELFKFAPDWILDLYSGSGNLTFPMAEKFPSAKISAVELSESAVERARARSSSISWHVGDVGRVLKKFHPTPGKGVVVLDPPRVGCDKSVSAEILRIKPEQIIYVSCNPTTFVRDVEPWLEHGHYRLSSVQGVDMFPQTEHVELVASLCSATSH